MKLKLMIVDDDVLIRESLKFIIESLGDFEVVAVAEDGKQCIDLLQKHPIDLLLLDLRMPIMGGVEVLAYLKAHSKQWGHIKTLVLTTFDEEELISGVVANGAAGYLLKNSKPDKIISALQSVAMGNGVFEAELVQKLGVQTDKQYSKNIEAFGLSKRETEIVTCIAEGLSNKEIASSLYISEGTVKNYITSILTKMDLKHRTQIAIAYLKQG
ncbi:MAG: response regulator [Cellulosilyticaceae bacterium]